MYWIDPDGQGVDPIHSNCDMATATKKCIEAPRSKKFTITNDLTGKTFVLHDKAKPQKT
jgi:hypothetical protein